MKEYKPSQFISQLSNNNKTIQSYSDKSQ